jgi:hypothetical protein
MEITREGSTENAPPPRAVPAGLLGTYTHGVRALALTGISPGNPHPRPNVCKEVTRLALPARGAGLYVLSLAAALTAPLDNYTSAQEKLARIESDQLPAGSRLELSAAEVNAYVTNEAPKVTDGVRNPRLELLGNGLARGTALIDFARVERSQGQPPGWLLTKLLEGEHLVSVSVRIRSSGGQATVDVQRVEVSGVSIEGAALDFLIQHFLLGLYPNAVVGHPFTIGHRVERVDVRPRGVTVVLGS